MYFLKWLLAVALFVPIAAVAQPAPGSGIATPTGTMAYVGDFQWNGTAWVPAPGGSSSYPTSVSTTPATRTLVPLDVATVTTGGTAVTALSAGHRSAGGWLYNPSTATISLCINETGSTASGTVSLSSLTCIPPDRTYQLTPSANIVSVVSSDSAHGFSGYGYQ